MTCHLKSRSRLSILSIERTNYLTQSFDSFRKTYFSEIKTKDPFCIITDAAKKRPHFYCMCRNVDILYWKNENGIF